MSRLGESISCVVLVLISLAAPSRASADGPNRAGVVVSFGDGRSESVCVAFDEPEISGAELLSSAGLPLVTMGSSAGAAVCSIDGVGCGNPGDCFCRCHGGACEYWAYYNLEDGVWRYSATGASLRKVHGGNVDGWAWGAGGIGTGAQPAASRIEDICPPLLAATTAAPTAASQVEAAATQAVATATAPAAASTVEIGPVTVLPPTPTESPLESPLPTVASSSGGGSSGRPTWEIALAAAVIAALAMTSLVLFRGRFRG